MKFKTCALVIIYLFNSILNDLYEVSLAVHPANSKPGNVHYTEKGYELLAQPIITKIKMILKK